MLEVGNGGMTHEEEKTHFALWAIAKAPLIIGCDLTTVNKDSLAILTNAELIAVNQDPDSKQAVCTINCSRWDRFIRTPTVHTTKLGGGAIVASITNWRAIGYGKFEFNLGEIGVVPAPGEDVMITDLWTGERKFHNNGSLFFVSEIAGHGNATFKFEIAPTKPVSLTQN